VPSEQAPDRIPRTVKKKRTPLDYLIVVVIVVLVLVAARYQEEIGGFFRLHAWDRGAPGRAVVEFLKAGKKGDRAQADTYMGAPQYQPLIKNGTWLGYSTTVQGTKIVFRFDELFPAASLQPTSTEFDFVGSGGAEVVVPDKRGKPVRYSLMRMGDQWKIISIRGGRMEQSLPGG
jgi:hypothetical protein